MIEIKHLATTKLPNEISRLLFEIESTGHSDFKCELVVNLHWLLGSIHEISVGNYHLQKNGFKEIFHIEVPDNIAKQSSRFNWQLISFVSFNGIYSRLKGAGKMSTMNLSSYLITTFAFLIPHLVKKKNIFQF